MDDKLNKALSILKSVKDSGVTAGVITDKSKDLISRILKVTSSIEFDVDNPKQKPVIDTTSHLKTETYLPKQEIKSQEIKEPKKRGPKAKK